MTAHPTRPGPASVLALAAAFALLAGIVFAGRGSPEPDSYYHLRYAWLLARGELPRGTFPWASASTWATAFADKDWLYHQALRPFVSACDPDLLLAGKCATLFFATLLVGSLAFVLARRGAPRPGELAAFALVSSYTLLQRVTVARTLTLAVTLLILLFWALVERRTLVTLLLATAYPLAYAAIPVPIALGVACAVAFRLRGERLGARPGAALVAGTGAGVLLHPDFPRNVTLAWDQLVRVLLNAWAGTRLGQEEAIEFRAFSVHDVALGSFPLWLALGGAVVLVLLADEGLALRRVKLVALALVAALVGSLFLESVNTRALLFYAAPLEVFLLALVGRAALRAKDVGGDTTAALGLAGAATLGSLLSVRFLEYAAPLGILALGLVLRDTLASETTKARTRELWQSLTPATRTLAPLAVGLLTLAAQVKLVVQAYGTVASAGTSRYEPLGAWLSEHATPGEVVYHAGWDEFPELFFHAHRQRYLVALDPAFLYYADADHHRYELWDRIGRGETEPSEARALGSRFVVLDTVAPRYARLAERLRKHSGEGRAVLRRESSGIELWELLAP